MAAPGPPTRAITLHTEECEPKAVYELVDGTRPVLRIERERSTAAKWGWGSSHLRYVSPAGQQLATTHGGDFSVPGIPYTRFKDSLGAKKWYRTPRACTASREASSDANAGTFVFDSIEYKLRISWNDQAKVCRQPRRPR